MTVPENRIKSMLVSQEDLIKLARVDLATFFELVFPVLHGGSSVVWADYLDLLTYLLMSTADGVYPRLMLNLPPGHMKSMLVSIIYVAWCLGRDPSKRFICISYGDDLAHYLSSRTRDLMQSAIYRKIFPGTKLLKKAEDFLRTTKGGYRYATAVGSDIVGLRADQIILDDPLRPDDASSGIEKERVRTWIQNSVLTRFKRPTDGIMIAVGHRVSTDDAFSMLEESGFWFTIKLPLVAETTECFETEDGSILMERQPGEILNPGWMSRKDIERLQSELAPYVYASQYQQRPLYGSSGMCSVERFKRYRELPRFEAIIHSWDIAVTTNGKFSVCTKFGLAKVPLLGDVLFLIGVVRIRVEGPDVREAILGHDRLDKPDLIILDSGGAGLPILQGFQRQGLRHIYGAGDIPDNPQSKPKIQRFTAALNYIYDGKIQFPESAPYMEKFLGEFGEFPDGRFNDQVDSVTQVAANFNYAVHLARLKLRHG